jgi:tripartite-type tricarboxylate transporter receptor subunit TctC
MRTIFRFISLALCSLVLSILWHNTGHADEWPSRPITLVVPFPPGGMLDVVGRSIADDLGKALNQPVIVENHPGAGGTVGTESVARAAPDGYTLLISAIGPIVIKPLLDKNPIFNPKRDLTPILLIGDSPNILITNTKRGFKSIDNVIAYAKQNPGKLTIGYPGVGTVGHLIALLFAQEAHIETTLVSYPGTMKLIPELLGGHIDFASIAYGPTSNTTKILAVTADERVDFLPDIPTMKESSPLSRVVGSTWLGVFTPAGLPAPIISKLNKIMNDFINKEETKKKFVTAGFHILGGAPERLKKQMEDDYAQWSSVIEAASLGSSND